VSSRDRIMAALRNEQPDRVPLFELWINESCFFKTARLLGLKVPPRKEGLDTTGQESLESIEVYCSMVEELGLDATCFYVSKGHTPIDDKTRINRYGVVEKLNEVGEPTPVDGPIKTPADLDGFDMVSRLRPEDFEGIEYIVNRLGPDLAHFGTVWDPFVMSWFLRGGMQNLFMDFIANPDLVHRLAQVVVQWQKAVIDRFVEIGVDVIVVNGDLASTQATLMSPRHYREFILPYHRELVQYIHDQGKMAVKHCDGNMWAILDDMIEIGFDGLHPIQPQCMDLAEVKAHTSGRLCLIGNIDCEHLLPFGTEEEVEEAVKEAIAVAAPGGGYILSSSNSIHPACRPENFIAMIRAAKAYGRY